MSQIPEWALNAAIATVVGIILSTLLAWKFWKPIWRKLSKQSPIHVHIETDSRVIFANLRYDWITFSQFVPLTHSELPPPPGGFATEMGAWAKELGGFPACHCNYDVTITAKEDMHVVVSALRVQAKSVPLPAGCIVTRGVGGASMEFRRIQVDLDSSNTRASWVERGGAPGDPFDFQLSPGESAKFNLLVDAANLEDVDMYEWWGTLELLVKGKRKTVRVGRSRWQRWFNRGGNAFRLVNRDRRPSFMNIPGSDVDWEPSPF
ncbi:hypothetical protein [Rhodococcus qingshengii]|uniref:hypothetical protein n=1 Tax=Rhodococcus qingshengii TaxID=334542 RepID=UPI0024BA8001|nr:hypothetical protein [Rhodococcus qingshengii]MDJ0440610.1 hypothetical protein [Rhodococcus qingshengii]